MTERLLGIFTYCDAWLEAEKIKFLQDPNNKLLFTKFNCQMKITVTDDFETMIPRFLKEQFKKHGKHVFFEGLWVEPFGEDKVKLIQLEVRK